MASALTPAERSLHAQLASYDSWAKEQDPTARTEPARRAFRNKFEKIVAPDGVLPPQQRLAAPRRARRTTPAWR